MARGRDNSVLCYPVVETIHRQADLFVSFPSFVNKIDIYSVAIAGQNVYYLVFTSLFF